MLILKGARKQEAEGKEEGNHRPGRDGFTNGGR
jgi:hypothetical protein